MVKYKSIQVFELRNWKIADNWGRISLFSKNPNTNIGDLYHTNIVSPITNGQYKAFEIFLNELNNICFLFGRWTTENNRWDVGEGLFDKIESLAT